MVLSGTPTDAAAGAPQIRKEWVLILGTADKQCVRSQGHHKSERSGC